MKECLSHVSFSSSFADCILTRRIQKVNTGKIWTSLQSKPVATMCRSFDHLSQYVMCLIPRWRNLYVGFHLVISRISNRPGIRLYQEMHSLLPANHSQPNKVVILHDLSSIFMKERRPIHLVDLGRSYPMLGSNWVRIVTCFS